MLVLPAPMRPTSTMVLPRMAAGSSGTVGEATGNAAGRDGGAVAARRVAMLRVMVPKASTQADETAKSEPDSDKMVVKQ